MLPVYYLVSVQDRQTDFSWQSSIMARVLTSPARLLRRLQNESVKSGRLLSLSVHGRAGTLELQRSAGMAELAGR